jgi:nitronate monooxygenase
LQEGTLADPQVYQGRERICDLGFLRTLYKRADGKLGYRCPAEPVADYVHKGGAIEDTEGRICLCNALGATAGFAQVRKNGNSEPPLVTSGDSLAAITQFIPSGATRYSARDVIQTLL